MSYELGENESLGHSLRRLIRKQVELAIAIAKGERETNHTPVHETRQHLKKARAALRLVRKEVGRGLFRKLDRCLRDVGRLVSEIRDAEVRLQTVRQFQGITQRQGRAGYRNLETMLILELENFMAAFAEWQTQAVPILEAVQLQIENAAIEQASPKQVRRAVQKAYKCGRDALATAKENPSAENFHEVRREAKMLWYQLRILRPVNRVVLKTLTDDLDSLGHLLGQAHDLNFLAERLEPERGTAAWQREGHKLLALIEVSQSDLQRGAAELAERFFAERPRDFGCRVAAWLEDWASADSSSVAPELMA
jgi:CHAD domain-containing protein